MSDLVFLSPEYKQQVYEQWLRFQREEPVDHSIVREVIYNSWRRCKAAAVDLFQPVQKVLGHEQVQGLLAENGDLLDCSASIMDDVFSVIRASQSTMVLADSRGVVLRALPRDGGGPVVGSVVLEKYIGTAGIATCLEEQCPTKVFAAEHYCASNHGWSCSAAPICDRGGGLVGALGVTSHCASFHLHTSGMIQAAVHAIAEQLHLRELLGEQRVLLELLDEGVVMLDAEGRVCTANRKALALLGLKDAVNGRKLNELARFNGVVRRCLEEGLACTDEETSIRTSTGHMLGCVISAAVNEGTRGMVLTLREASRMRALATRLTGAKAIYDFPDILGASGQLREAVRLAEKAAESDVTTLILGESGTGKELFAQAIHNRSGRSGKPFIVVNCGALPRDLVQSELFGYVEGAFTGASSRGKPGKFELADGGSIFLDEIGEMPLDAQVSLLRLLQNGEVGRVGGGHTRNVDVRVIAATNRDLEEAVRQNAFREDLYYRLNVFALNIPPLREREGDIEELTRHFLENFAKSLGKPACGISPEALNVLLGYPWPGNVRELQNALERAVHLAAGPIVQLHDLPLAIVARKNTAIREAAEARAATAFETTGAAGFSGLGQWERAALQAALRKSRGNVKRAAEELGLARSTVYYKLKSHQLEAASFRAGAEQPPLPEGPPSRTMRLTARQLADLAAQLKSYLNK